MTTHVAGRKRRSSHVGLGLVDDDLTNDRYDQDGPGLLESQPDAVPAEPAGKKRTTPQRARKTPAVEKTPPATGEPSQPSSPRHPAEGRTSDGLAQPLALYRRYRPDRFDEIIGQDHITEPLMRALTNNKVNHAYLFSGPRGCGKTSSARILARCLNCEQGPTATPCGVCQSCRDLATGGPGSIDVIEMDAASHGLVDDARDLRERAIFMPVQSRYKVYIIDEAHMVTTQGFNALLKLVEEPPPHVKFIFATTEPDKVIGTIRSRTHHYPFRLVPPKIMQAYLQKICSDEGVATEPGVLPLVVRAGAGSVRDALSVLDQLFGGAGPDGVKYADTAALLGYTPDALLDETVDAFAAGDGAGVFAAIDKVIETGEDPRHFGADLLQRLRDVLIVATVPDALTSGLLDVPADQAERLKTQAQRLGQARLTYAAEVMAKGLTGMRGTTVPRLHLELMCARVLLPMHDAEALAARLDRVEKRLGGGSAATPALGAPTASGTGVTGPRPAPAAAPVSGSRPRFDDDEPAPVGPPTSQRPASPLGHPAEGRTSGAEREAGSPQAVPQAAFRLRDGQAKDSLVEPVETSTNTGDRVSTSSTDVSSGSSTSDFGITQMREIWPSVLERVLKTRKVTYLILSQNVTLIEARDGVLTLGFDNPGARDMYLGGNNPQLLTNVLSAVTGRAWRTNAIMSGPDSSTMQRPATAQRTPEPQVAAQSAPAAPVAPEPVADTTPEQPGAVQPSSVRPTVTTFDADEVSADDIDIDDADDAAGLLSSALGAEMIAEEIDDV